MVEARETIDLEAWIVISQGAFEVIFFNNFTLVSF